MHAIILQIVGLLLIITLNIMFFSKKNFKNIETKIYSKLLIFNVLFIVIGINTFIIAEMTNNKDLIAIFQKLYMCILVLLNYYSLQYCFYAFNFKYSNNKKMKNFITLLTILFMLLILILPLNVVFQDDLLDGNGLSYDVALIYTIISFSYFLFTTIYLFIKRNSLKKIIPFVVLIILYLIGFLLRGVFKELIFEGFFYSYILLIMYHTIENPDMKMLEEVHRAKQISDNANEEKTLFLYNMTNDIRSITKDIDDSADYILDEIDNKKVDKELIKETARDIKSSTAKFTTMTNEILDISSIDTSSIKVYNNKYNIKLLLKQLVTNYKEKCKDKGLTFRSNIDTTLPQYLFGDSVSLKKVIDILLENSYKYTENGFIELSVNTIIKNDIARLIITVEDSGTGMKVEELNKAINTKKEEDSTNLNNSLYNAKKLITLMNGTIVPSSTYGSGTSIKIILDQKIYEEKSKTSKYNKELDKKRVLLVDDNISSQKLFTKILSGTNIELDIVSLGKECLDKIRNKEKYDLILLDEEMKPLSGIEVITKLKNIKNFNTKVILLTKNNDYEYNEEYLKYGFIDYILKPLDKNKVLEKISKYLK